MVNLAGGPGPSNAVLTIKSHPPHGTRLVLVAVVLYLVKVGPADKVGCTTTVVRQRAFVTTASCWSGRRGRIVSVGEGKQAVDVVVVGVRTVIVS